VHYCSSHPKKFGRGARWSLSFWPVSGFPFRPRSVTEFLEVFGPVLGCFFGAQSKHPKTPQNTFGLFGRPVLARLGPTKLGETRRAGVELKRFTPLAFSRGWRRGRRGDEAGRRRRDAPGAAGRELLPPPLIVKLDSFVRTHLITSSLMY
jgi:hypothetical protein